MKLRNVSVLAATAILIGIWGASATGCVNLDVGPTLSQPDSLGEVEGLDEPGHTGNPGATSSRQNASRALRAAGRGPEFRPLPRALSGGGYGLSSG